MTNEEMLATQLERLRTILTQLEVVRSGERHDELLDRARVVIAAVRKTRGALSRGCVLDYANRAQPHVAIH